MKSIKQLTTAPQSEFGHATVYSGWGILLLLLLVLPLWSAAQDSSNYESRLSSFMQEAAQNNPGLKADYRHYLAALEKVPQVNTLPDPELSMGYFLSPIETRVGPQHARFGLTQMFPWFGTLEVRGKAAEQNARAAFEVFQESRNKLFFQIQNRWFKLYHIEKSIRIMQENIDILEIFESLATRRYETGQVDQVDVLRVQIEKEDLKTRLELLKDNRRVAIQQFYELLNRKEDEDFTPADTLQEKELIMDGPELEKAVLKQNPMLTRLDYQASSALTSIEVARKAGLPSMGFGLDYIFTGTRDAALTDNGQDAILARAGIRIPLYRKKYRAQKREAQLKLQSVESRREATQNNLLTQLEEAIRDLDDAKRRITLYRETQIQRTRQAIDILTEQYTTSATDFEELLQLQRKLLDYELARETALVDRNSAVAYIEYLYGKHNTDPMELSLRN